MILTGTAALVFLIVGAILVGGDVLQKLHRLIRRDSPAAAPIGTDRRSRPPPSPCRGRAAAIRTSASPARARHAPEICRSSRLDALHSGFTRSSAYGQSRA